MRTSMYVVELETRRSLPAVIVFKSEDAAIKKVADHFFGTIYTMDKETWRLRGELQEFFYEESGLHKVWMTTSSKATLYYSYLEE
jgi:hypothetical protein